MWTFTGSAIAPSTIRTDRRELSVAELYRLPTADDRSTTTLEPDELIRSVLEGVAFSQRQGLDLMRAAGASATVARGGVE